MSESEATGLTRREVIKRSVVVGGLIWVAPTILASPAGASVFPCTGCTGRVYGVRHNVNGGCITPGTDSTNPDNCGVRDDPNTGGRVGAFMPGCCLMAAGLLEFSESADNQTHQYRFGPGVTVCGGAFGRCAGDCVSQFDVEVTEYFEDPSDPSRISRMTVSCAGLTHSEVFVCVEGTTVPVC